MKKFRASVETNGVERPTHWDFDSRETALSQAEWYADMLTHRVADEADKKHVPVVKEIEVEESQLVD